MPIPEVNDVLRFAAYGEDSDDARLDLSWSQSLRTKTATYYIIKAKNTSKGDSDVLLYIERPFYTDEGSSQYLGKIPGAKREGDEWVVTINDRFQYGQKNAQGENRWLVLHDKNNKMYQHRFLMTTVQGNAADWAQKLAKSFGAGDLAENMHKLGSGFIGDYLRNF